MDIDQKNGQSLGNPKSWIALTVVISSAFACASCGRSIDIDSSANSQDFPPVVLRSEPYNTAPGVPGAVIFKNTFDHDVDLSVVAQAEASQCSRNVGPRVVKLARNAEISIEVGKDQKLCFSMGKNLSKPLSVGICEARETERIALPAYAGCYRL